MTSWHIRSEVLKLKVSTIFCWGLRPQTTMVWRLLRRSSLRSTSWRRKPTGSKPCCRTGHHHFVRTGQQDFCGVMTVCSTSSTATSSIDSISLLPLLLLLPVLVLSGFIASLIPLYMIICVCIYIYNIDIGNFYIYVYVYIHKKVQLIIVGSSILTHTHMLF